MWVYWSAFAIVMAWVFGATIVWALDAFPVHAENVVAVVSLGIVCIIQAIALCVMWGVGKQEHEKKDATHYSNRPADQPQSERRVAQAIAADHYAEEKEHHADEKSFWCRQIVAAWALNIVTLGAAAVAIGGLWLVSRSIQHTDQGNIDANRAWIEPAGLDAAGDIKGDNEIALKVYYANVGRSPALNINTFFTAGTAPNLSANDYSTITAGPNNTCKGLSPVNDKPAIFPDPLRQHWIPSIIPRKDIQPSVQINMGALYVQGCYAYSTMHEIHFSWFCIVAYRNGSFATLNSSSMCADGNGAE